MSVVRLTKRYVEMENHSQDPLNPHPVFPQWSPWNVYPYRYWGTMERHAVMQRYYMPTIENEFIRVTIAADIGGRIWDLYDKIGKRHLANFNVGVRTYNAGFGLNYTCGGIECNYPLAHAVTTSRPREVSMARYPDGSAAIIISEYEQIWRTRWAVAYVLHPGRSYVEVRVRIYNRTPHESRYMYWNNCGFVLNRSSQFIFPEEAGAMHGMEKQTFSWPIWRHRDLSYWRNVPPEMLGLYMLDAREPFFGYYDHDGDFGLVHYADLADLPGKKYWTWGTHPEMIAQYRRTHHTLGEVYGEIQSGRIVIQEHLDPVPPETECQWSGFWYPVRGTGAFTAAGPGAAMRVESQEEGAGRTSLTVTAIGNGRFPEARLLVTSDGIAPSELPMPLDPVAPTKRTLHISGKVGPEQHTKVLLKDPSAGILASSTLRHPSKRDSWREVVEISRGVKPASVEELFMEAEAAARDWGNHDLRPLYEKVIAQDSAFAPARSRLGKLATWQGLYDEAIEHFRIARERDPNSLELRYYHGVALMYAGRVEEASKAFELAARYDWENRSLVRLAELRMRERDWHHALKHLDRVAASAPRLTRPRGLRAICFRKIGDLAAASTEVEAALAVDGQDPFLQIEAMFIKAGGPGRALDRRAIRRLLEQVREDEPPLLEAAFDYLAVELFDEVDSVVRIIPKPGPLAMLVQAYAAEKRGRQREANALLRRACRLDPVGHCPWRLEMIPILNWGRKLFPKEPRLAFFLGELLVARRRLDEGVALWREAEALGERHYLLFSCLGYYESRIAKKPERAADYFRRAVRAEPKDLYVKHELFEALRSSGKNAEAVAFLEKETAAVRRSPLLAHDLLRCYLREGNYRKFDALCSKVDFSINFQIPGPHILWWPRHFQEAMRLEKQGRLREALRILENPPPCPRHLGEPPYSAAEEDRRCYHIGCLYEKLGNLDEARKWWERAVSLPHYTGYEPAYWVREWGRRYYQALSLMKLGRESEANALFDGMELLAASPHLPLAARESVMRLVERGRFAPDDEKDPIAEELVEVRTRAEA